ncbi:hypothetical protein C8J56DRAFT_1059735 [Mycena floridula]|nr:hypothetical protein C8J56DRAFT_1059735 [Mycena floridula]
MSSFCDPHFSSKIESLSEISLADADADLTLPELHLRFHHYLASFAGQYPEAPQDTDVTLGHNNVVRLCLGTENNLANAGRFFLYVSDLRSPVAAGPNLTQCINDDPMHINACCWDVFHGYLTEPLPENQLARLAQIRDEILHRPRGHWGEKPGGRQITAEEHLQTAQSGARYLGSLGMYEFFPRCPGSITPVPNPKPPLETSDLSLEQLESCMKRCIKAFASLMPKLPAGLKANGHKDQLKLCCGRGHFRLQDAGRWLLECAGSNQEHKCNKGFHGFLTPPIHKDLIPTLAEIRKRIIKKGGKWGVGVSQNHQFDVMELAGIAYLRSIGIQNFPHHRYIASFSPAINDWPTPLYLYASGPSRSQYIVCPQQLGLFRRKGLLS